MKFNIPDIPQAARDKLGLGNRLEFYAVDDVTFNRLITYLEPIIEDCVSYLDRTRSYKHRTTALISSTACAIYRNGKLNRIVFGQYNGEIKKKGRVYKGREVFKSFAETYNAAPSAISLVFATALFYGGILENRGFKVIQHADSYCTTSILNALANTNLLKVKSSKDIGIKRFEYGE